MKISLLEEAVGALSVNLTQDEVSYIINTPNKAYSGRVGVCAINRHFSGFEFFLHLKPFSISPTRR